MSAPASIARCSGPAPSICTHNLKFFFIYCFSAGGGEGLVLNVCQPFLGNIHSMGVCDRRVLALVLASRPSTSRAQTCRVVTRLCLLHLQRRARGCAANRAHADDQLRTRNLVLLAAQRHRGRHADSGGRRMARSRGGRLRAGRRAQDLRQLPSRRECARARPHVSTGSCFRAHLDYGSSKESKVKCQTSK